MTTNNFCRICLDIDIKGEFLDIFSTMHLDYNKNITINNLVKECSSVNIEQSDAFPKLICTLCLQNLNIAYKFKELCLQTDKKLRERDHLLNLEKTETVDIESQIPSDVCDDFEFTNENLSLNESLRNEKFPNYACSHCTKVFKTETKRNRHQSVHTRRIICEICGKVSGHETNFEIHMRTHTGDKPFRCRVCGVSKTTEGDLKSHMKTHSDECKYSCHICGKQFKWLSNQLRHMRWHKGERTHKCNVCEKSFFEASDVRKHMLTHTGEKPFGCRICERAFIRRGLLRTHYRVMHNTSMPSCY